MVTQFYSLFYYFDLTFRLTTALLLLEMDKIQPFRETPLPGDPEAMVSTPLDGEMRAALAQLRGRVLS